MERHLWGINIYFEGMDSLEGKKAYMHRSVKFCSEGGKEGNGWDVRKECRIDEFFVIIISIHFTAFLESTLLYRWLICGCIYLFGIKVIV
jgi:hypothetical protein